MTVYKCTLGIGQTVMGATESYYSADTSADVAATRLNRLLAARNDMLWQSTYWTGVRISAYGFQRRSQFLLPGNSPFPASIARVIVPARGTWPGTSESLRPDQFRATLQYLSFFDTDRSSTRYLSNIADAVSAFEPDTVDPAGFPGWFDSMQKFFALLITDGWQIRARQRIDTFAPWPITGVTAQAVAPFRLGIVVTAAGAPPFAQGDKITLQKFRPPKGMRQRTVNGSWTIQSVDAVSQPGELVIYLRGSDGIAAEDVRFMDTSRIQRVGYSLYPIVKAYYNRIGIHKRGGPLGRPAGRRLSRPSLGS